MYVIPEIRSNKTEIKQNKTGINSLAQVSDKADESFHNLGIKPISKVILDQFSFLFSSLHPSKTSRIEISRDTKNVKSMNVIYIGKERWELHPYQIIIESNIFHLEIIMTFLQYFSPFILIECIEPPTWAPREQLHKSLRGNYMAWVKWEPILELFSTKKS